MVSIINPINVTGWNDLIDGNIVSASFTLFDTALMGWTISFLFFVYQFILFQKTKSVELCFATGSFFVALYIGAANIGVFPVLNPVALNTIFLVLVIELGAIIWRVFWR